MNIPKGGFLVLAMAAAAVLASRSNRCASGFCGPSVLLPPVKATAAIPTDGGRPGDESGRAGGPGELAGHLNSGRIP
jgi:hypothetical protein